MRKITCETNSVIIIYANTIGKRFCANNFKALDLSPALLKKREVIVIDIYDDSLLKKTVSHSTVSFGVIQ